MRARLGLLVQRATDFDVVLTVYFIGLGCWVVSTLAGLVGADPLALVYAWFALLAFVYMPTATLAGWAVEARRARRARAEAAKQVNP